MAQYYIRMNLENFHRDDGPAIVEVNGQEEWYQNGKLHREDGPALKFDEDYQEWYQNDKLHREDGPATTPSWWHRIMVAKWSTSTAKTGQQLYAPTEKVTGIKMVNLTVRTGQRVTEADGTQFYYNNGRTPP